MSWDYAELSKKAKESGELNNHSNSNEFITWVKAHKKQLVIVTGSSVATIMGIIFVLKNKEAIAKLWTSLEDSIKNAPMKNATAAPKSPVALPACEALEVSKSHASPQTPFFVNQHIRTMPIGWQHSYEKGTEAAALGITLLSNQTLVDGHTKCAA